MSPRVLPRRPLTLRARMLLTVAAICAVACLVVGAGAVVALRTIGVQQLDVQLGSAQDRSVRYGDHDSDDHGGRPGDGPARGPGGGPARGQIAVANGARNGGVTGYLEGPGQAAGTVAARLDGAGALTGAAVVSESGQVTVLPAAAARELGEQSSAAQPRSVDLPGLGDYRVAASAQPDGGTLVVGLPLRTVHTTAQRLAVAVALVALVVLLAALLAGSVLLRLALRPLDRVRATAVRVSELPLERGEVALAERVPNPDPHTEVGAVATALNRMLEHVNDALAVRRDSELRLRRFVADASHELRTPLASVRGYAELLRRRPEPLPDDVAHALARVESEAMRMGGLVEDMLLLARLDEGRPMACDLVDLAVLTEQAVGDARVAGPDHTWLLQRDPADGHADVTVVGDGPRLTQVVVNLLSNARTHTPAGTRVRVRLSTRGGPDDGEAVLVVADDGPGMPPDLAAEAFERFTRGDSSRSRAAGSTGLGLSIVDGVVRAHHGTVRLDSTPGAGTTVTVVLPLAGLDADGPARADRHPAAV